MNTSYEVGAVFRIADQATPTLTRLATELERLEKLANGVKSAFERLGTIKTTLATESLGKLSKELTAISEKAVIAGDSMQKGLSSASGVIGGAAEKAALLARDLAAAVKEGNALAKIKLSNINGGSGGGGGGGAPRPGGGIRQHRPGHGGVHKAGEAGLMLGIFGSIGMHETDHALHEMYDKRKEWEHVLEQMQIAGFDKDAHTGKTGQINRAAKAAISTGFKYGIGRTQVLEDIKELILPFGSVDHAVEFIDPLEKMRVVLNAVTAGKGNDARDSVYQMARAGELKGLVEAGDYNKYFSSMTKAIVASGGKITPKSFAQVTQYGKLASFGWSEEFYTKYLPTLMQTMNPSTAGQSLMSLFQTMGGTMKLDAANALEGLGLINQDKDASGKPIHYARHPKTGKISKILDENAIVGKGLFNTNPLEWARNFLLPKLEEKFGDLNNAENKENAIGYMGRIFGNRNSAAAAAELALRMKSFDRDHALISGAQGTEAAGGLLDKDPKTVEAKLKAAWDNFLTMMGGPAVEAAVSSMNALASGLNVITKWGDEHPTGVKIVVGALMGLAGAFAGLAVVGVAAGAVLLGPGGAAFVALTAYAGMLAGMAATNWEAVTKGVDLVWTKLKDFWGWLSTLGGLGSHKPGTGGPASNAEDGLPGVQKQSFLGDGLRSLVHNAAFSTGGAIDSGSADERFAKCVYVGVLAALRDFGGSGGGFGGGGGGGFGGGFGGTGFHRASFGGGGGINGRGGIGAILGNAPAGSLTDIINREAAAAGIDPRIMQGIRAGESLHSNAYDVKDDAIESSWGPFQLNRRRGLGVQFERETGLDVRNPSSIPAQVRWVAQFLKKGGSLRNWAGYHGPRDADPSWGNSGLSVGVVNGKVDIKAGAGVASGPLAAFADQMSKAGGVRFTAFNDAYHAGTGSMHARGLAADMTGDGDKIMANARAMMDAAGLQEGRDFKMIDEYRHRSKRWTGGHIHFQFNTPEAAAAYAAAQRGSVPPTAGAPPKSSHDKMVSIPVHIGGHKVAHVMHRIMTAHATFPTSAGTMDTHGHQRLPGTRVTDTA